MTATSIDVQAGFWPAEDLEALGHCPVCLGRERSLLHTELTDRLFGCAPGLWQLHSCTACEVAYLDPRPSPASIGRAYQTYFTHTEASVSVESIANKKPTLQQKLRTWVLAGLNDFRNARWGMQLQPSSPWGRPVVAGIWPLRNLLVAHMRNLPRRPPYPGARLLDVGCGSGAFLDLARSAGWNAQGVDFDPLAVAAARGRGLDVRCGGLEQMADQIGSFDYVTCSHVIEHVHTPAQWIKDMHSLLRPQGKLWLQTPNIASRGHVRYGPDWRGLEPPRHLILFTPAALTKLVQENGFRAQQLPMPLLMAIPVYDMSRKLRTGAPRRDGFAWFSLLHIPSLWDASMQSLQPKQAEFITIEATRWN